MRTPSVSTPCSNWERIGWRKTGAEIAQAFGAGAHDEGGLAELLVEDDAMIAGIGFGKLRKFAAGVPVEPAAVDDDATDRDAVAADPLGRGVITMSAPSSIGRLRKAWQRCCRSGAEFWRHGRSGATAGISSTSSPGLPMVSPITSRVFGLIAARNSSGARGLDEGGRDAEARQRMCQKIDGAAIERGGGDDVVAGMRSVAIARLQCRHAARGTDRADAGF